MPPKKKKKSNGSKKHDLKLDILNLLEKESGKPLTTKQIAFRLGVNGKKERIKLQEILTDLVATGAVLEPLEWKYVIAQLQEQNQEGIIDITRNGYGFVDCPHLEEDVFVSAKNILNAMNGDTVKIEFIKSRKGKSAEGKVVEVVSRARTNFVGIVNISDRFAFFIPDSQRIHTDFYVPLSKLAGAKEGEKVVVSLVDWPVGLKNPIGQVVKVLGKAGEHDVEMHAIIEEFGLPNDFPEQVIAESETVPEVITEEEIKTRRDFRQINTFTIDPADAKDYDDAISFRTIENNRFEVGVHIADVSHYLKINTELDKEAFRRATSVYLVDRTIPMLPEKLSNNLCSLQEKKDKLCFSAVFVLDAQAKIISEWFGKTIINSNRRFSYEEVQQIIESKEGELVNEILKVNELATKLREIRYKEGSFSFETEEVKFRLDEQGKPVEVFKKLMKDSNLLIEDLMLLANKRVAEFVFKGGQAQIAFPYRIHDVPNEEKLNNFRRIALKFGYQIDNSNKKNLAFSLNQLLDDVEGKPEQNFLQTLAIRSMAKAAYSPDNIGHYGLAFQYYTHFTSPIRRYPDVMVHRILFEMLEKQQHKLSSTQMKINCKHCSEREVNAESAERASIKYKQVEYMKERLNQEFEGVISGIIESGIFVELIENKCEGFVPTNSLTDDFYIFEEDNYRMVGYNNKRTYTLGQTVMAKAVAANLTKRILDFQIIQ